jgi:hypothetical protein
MPNYALGKDTVNLYWPVLVEGVVLVTGEVKAYPNPAQDMINTAYRFEKGEERILQIYDLVGTSIEIFQNTHFEAMIYKHSGQWRNANNTCPKSLYDF